MHTTVLLKYTWFIIHHLTAKISHT